MTTWMRYLILPFVLLFANYLGGVFAWLLACNLFGWRPALGLVGLAALAIAGAVYTVWFAIRMIKERKA